MESGNSSPKVHPLKMGFGFSFLIEDKAGLYLVDSGSPGQESVILRKMNRLGRNDLRLIWITHAHFDHFGSAAAIRNATGAPVGIHPMDVVYLESGVSPLGSARGRGTVLTLGQGLMSRIWPLPKTSVDFNLEDGESLEGWGLQAKVIHTPGHTPGHTCLLLAEGTAFAGDLVARNPNPRLQDLLATGWEQLPSSLEKLQAANPTRVYTGHSVIPLTRSQVQNLRSKKR